jgi:type IV secretory pathway TrbF-like protein
MSKWNLWSPQNKKDEAPEKQRYSRYYEHDGALRAYANRAMVLAFASAATALLAVGLAAYVRLQPPTVIRVDANGNAAVLGKASSLVSVSQTASDSEPTELEKYAFSKAFLDRYLTFSPANVSRNWAEAVNMMTSNLRREALSKMKKENLVGKIQDEQMRSEFQLRRLEPSKESPLNYTAFGVKEVHRVAEDHSETTDKIVSEFHVRLVVERRSQDNPSGLFIAEFSEEPIEGEKRAAVLRETQFDSQGAPSQDVHR